MRADLLLLLLVVYLVFFFFFIITLPTVYTIFASSIFGVSVRNYFDVSPLFCKVTNNSEVWKLYSDLCWKDESQKDREKVCLKALIVIPVRITLVLICCGRICTVAQKGQTQIKKKTQIKKRKHKFKKEKKSKKIENCEK